MGWSGKMVKLRPGIFVAKGTMGLPRGGTHAQGYGRGKKGSCEEMSGKKATKIGSPKKPLSQSTGPSARKKMKR